MKAFLVLASLVLSFSVIAGPEDHMHDTCFTSSNERPYFVSSIFCFENATLNPLNNVVLVDGYASNVPGTLATTKLIRQSEDFYTFEAATVINNKWESGCGVGELATLIISGNADFNGYIDAKTLNFKVKYEMTSDTCHSIPQSGVVNFTLSK
jgi:hypothetical protein